MCCVHSQVILKIPNAQNHAILANALEECDILSVAEVQELQETLTGDGKRRPIFLQVCMNTYQQSSTTVHRNASYASSRSLGCQASLKW
jgi:hypothetical protein